MNEDALSRAVKRIEYLTLAVGVAGALYLTFTRNWRYGLGFAAGSVLSWLNYRWLRAGVLAATSVQATTSNEAPPPVRRAPFVLKFAARFALLLLAVYVILTRSFLPASAVLAGLFCAVAAVLLQMVYLLARGSGATNRI